MADAAKYQKLASEYAKLKAQFPVLKKAYIDEQTACSEVKDQLKEKEQAVRKFEQEIDSLTFRNQQLSKRVLLLQDELDDAQSHKKKGKNKHSDTSYNPSPISAGVFNEELQRKIEENAMLSKQVDDSTRMYQGRIEELEAKVKEYETKFNQHQEVNDVNVQKNKVLIDRLQEEKAMIEVKLQTIETDLKKYRSRSEKAEESLSDVQCQLQKQLDNANKIISDKLPFIDTKNRELNGLNLPTHDRKHQLRARELVSQTANHLTDMVQALSNFFTYSEQRSKIYPAECISEPMSPVNIQYCKYLHENVQYLRPLEQSFKVFLSTLNEDTLTTLETATDLQIFSRKFNTCIEYFNKLLPYQLLSIEEECAVSSCTSTLETKNRDLHKSFKDLNQVFNKLQSYISLLASQSSKTCQHPKINHPRFFTLLCQVLKDLDHAVRDVSKHYNSKVSLEHQLPTASQKLKTTDECVVSSLISLVTCTSKLSSFLSGNIDFFSQTGGYRTRGSSIGNDPTMEGPRSNPATVQFRQKAANYLALLTIPCPESVPHKTAVQNRKTLLSSAESKEGLSKQLTTFQQRVGRLEQDKEHYMLELQLLQIKYDNEIQKVKKIEKELQETKRRSQRTDSIEDNITIVMPSASTSETQSKPSVLTSQIGKLEAISSPGTDAETRESLIKNHFTNRINELTLQLQDADSKSVSFHSEVRALHKQLQIADKTKYRAEDELKDTAQSLAQLKDEYQTTTKSYEGQLSMMSEHLAGLNEKLTQQKDEIDELRTQVSSKSGKKSRR
ncbi:protein phosphatase 1 regulatory subunit 21-like [Mytilus californianus]|uniref:protein phosphatase 1 regulatory subunit 21-like n=1 Tax=Mytilus californianus TaxID=6549 RepID=UPI002245A8A8|nr:protein phosphatase 1 regulatory subunit 21-like [Mytilus californianus]